MPDQAPWRPAAALCPACLAATGARDRALPGIAEALLLLSVALRGIALVLDPTLPHDDEEED